LYALEDNVALSLCRMTVVHTMAGGRWVMTIR
jgi:hypothetical protein